MDFNKLTRYGVLVLLQGLVVLGHGGMVEPPMRSIMWRYGFDTPVNYDWNALYCGGLQNFKEHKGRCGFCGDPVQGPFENDKGGVYDTGVIVRHYPAGLNEIEVKVEITAHHKGFFQFKLCANNDGPITQECLNRYPLPIREGLEQGNPLRYYPPVTPKLSELHVALPPDVVCDRCVLQWTYTAGNSYGTSEDGKSCIGCGIQETFVNCADISIGGTVDKIQVHKDHPPEGAVVEIPDIPATTAVLDNAKPNSNVNEILRDLGIEMPRPPAIVDPVVDQPSPVPPRNIGRALVPPSRVQSAPVQNRPNFIPPGRDLLTPPGAPRVFRPEPVHNTPFIMPPPSVADQDRGTNLIHSRPFEPQGQDRVHVVPSAGGRAHRPDVPTHQRWALSDFPHPSEVPGPLQNPRFDQAGPLVQPNGRHELLDSVGSLVNEIRNRHNAEGVTDVLARRPVDPHALNRPRTPRIDTRLTGHLRPGDPRLLDPVHAQRKPGPNLDIYGRPVFDIYGRPLNHVDPAMSKAILNGRELPQNHLRAIQRTGHSEIRKLDPHFVNSMRDLRNSHRQEWASQNGLYLAQSKEVRQIQENAQERPIAGYSVTTPAMPRRIIVHSMAVAETLLRRYPNLRGRVFLSRKAHLHNKYAHRLHKYARRQT